MKNWLDIYRSTYYDCLDIQSPCHKRNMAPGCFNRAKGFDLIFKTLLDKKSNDFNIIETGTTRRPNNWKDGNSGYLFTEFVKACGGTVRSVDISSGACEQAKAHITDDRYSVFCSDSVSWLQTQTDLSSVDLFYLDSYDVEWHNDQPSAEHHLKEFKIIEPYLKSGTIVAIDDNTVLANSKLRSGKGRLIVEYLETKGIYPVYDAYQIIYIIK